VSIPARIRGESGDAMLEAGIGGIHLRQSSGAVLDVGSWRQISAINFDQQAANFGRAAIDLASQDSAVVLEMWCPYQERQQAAIDLAQWCLGRVTFAGTVLTEGPLSPVDAAPVPPRVAAKESHKARASNGTKAEDADLKVLDGGLQLKFKSGGTLDLGSWNQIFEVSFDRQAANCGRACIQYRAGNTFELDIWEDTSARQHLASTLARKLSGVGTVRFSGVLITG
jgi:hypothetical protein